MGCLQLLWIPVAPAQGLEFLVPGAPSWKRWLQMNSCSSPHNHGKWGLGHPSFLFFFFTPDLDDLSKVPQCIAKLGFRPRNLRGKPYVLNLYPKFCHEQLCREPRPRCQASPHPLPSQHVTCFLPDTGRHWLVSQAYEPR